MVEVQAGGRQFRSGPVYTRIDGRGERDHAFYLGSHNDIVLYNVEAANGDRFRHRVLDSATFHARWRLA